MDSVANKIEIIPAGNPNRPGRKLDSFSFVTVHETANTAVGANAQMHADFVAQGGGAENVSFHFVVDDHESIQLLPEDEVGWHAGDGAHGPGNSTSVAIETCVNVDGDVIKTRDNLVRLIVALLRKHKLGVDRVVEHNHWSGKDCPHQMRLAGGARWNELIGLVTKGLSDPPPPSQGARLFKETGQYMGGGFLALWDKYGLEVCGYPLSGEYAGSDGYTFQDCENVIMQYKAGEQAKIGAGIRLLKYDK